ncbi:RNA polymerase sigma factor SigM [Actinomadura rubteroloni]|uniref:RNA polymerase sigma factor SigM n=1 Tax=Actinomadura rubteroloni TaxID=1926885 RepID=A0A2P4UCI5_9ACTN|nr:RNA polymerase sigma factor SigM [Actinomadura rubteroloni]
MLRARDGDAAAWTALVERHTETLWAVARSWRLSDADCADVVQITWLRLVERLDTIREPEAVGAWLVVTARREAGRTARERGHEPLGAASAALPPPDDVVAGREQVCAVGTALRGLPRRCRDLLRLAALVPRQAELAAALDIPVGGVGPTRARCLQQLRRKLVS